MEQTTRATFRNAGGWRERPAVLWCVGFAGFFLLGTLISAVSFPLMIRYGALIGVVVIGGPIVVVTSALAIPQFFTGWRSLKTSFGWQEWLWVLLFLSATTFAVADVNQSLDTRLDSWAVLRIGIEFIVAIVIGFRMSSGKSSLGYLFSGLPGMLTAFCGIALVSTVWSVSPPFTLFKSLEYLLDVVVLAVILESVTSTEDFIKLLNWTWVVYAIETGIAWVGAVVFPAYAWDEMGRLQSVYPKVGANNIGTTGATLALVAISRLLWRDRKSDYPWYFVVFLYGMASLLVSQTRNAIAGFMCGLFLLLVFDNRKWIVAMLGGIGIPLLLLTPVGTVVETYLRRGQSDEALHSLTGRMDWWAYAWQQLSYHPFTGLGAFAGGKFGVLAKLGVTDAAYLHSDWLEILVGTSFWGIAAFLPAVIGTWWFLGKGTREPWLSSLERQAAVECFAIIGLLTVHSIFNNELCWHPPLLFFVVLGYAELLRRRARDQKHSLAFAATARTWVGQPALAGSEK
jgi:O-Antigen ligase